jgi:hypothetical protein
MRVIRPTKRCRFIARACIGLAVHRFEGTSSSKKVTQDHEIVRKIGKRVDDQYEVSAIFTMRLEKVCVYVEPDTSHRDHGRVYRCPIEPVALCGIRCHDVRRQSFELNKGGT